MWDLIKDFLSMIGELAGLIVVALLAGVVWLLATVLDWLIGLGGKKRQND
jgi:hypothetical protein